MNVMKDDIHQLKATISSLQASLCSQVKSASEQDLGRELCLLRAEMAQMHQKINSIIPQSNTPTRVASPGHDPASRAPIVSKDTLKLTTWNCWGLNNAVPYVNELIHEGSDIIFSQSTGSGRSI